MNERHPSGHTPDYDAYTYDACSTGAYQAVGTAFADDTTTGTYGWLPQQQPADPYAYEPQQPGDVSYGTGGYGGYGYAEAQPLRPAPDLPGLKRPVETLVLQPTRRSRLHG